MYHFDTKPVLVISDVHVPYGEIFIYSNIFKYLGLLTNVFDSVFHTTSTTTDTAGFASSFNTIFTTTDTTAIPPALHIPHRDTHRTTYRTMHHTTHHDVGDGGRGGGGMARYDARYDTWYDARYDARAVVQRGIGAIVVAGDLFDFTALSPYTATAVRLPTVEEELERAGVVLAALRQVAPVYVVAGNHDDRFIKRLGQHLSFDVLIDAALSRAAQRLAAAQRGVSGQYGQEHPVYITDRDYLFVGDDVCIAHLSMARGHMAALRMASRAAARLRRHVLFGHTHRQGAQREDGSAYWGIGIGSCVGDMWYGQKYLRDTILYGRDGAFTQRGFALLQPTEHGHACMVYDEAGRPVFVKDGDTVICADTFVGKRVMMWE